MMTDEERQASEAGKAPRNTNSKKNNQQSSEIPINTDLTSDYEAGRLFVDARVRAFGAGVRDRMQEVQSAFQGFSGGQFVISEATYTRPALAPSSEQVAQSVMSLLYSSEEVA